MSAAKQRVTRRGFVGAAVAIAAAPLLPGRSDAAEGRNPGGSRRNALVRLRQSLDGRLVLPQEADFERMRRVASFNPRNDLRPAAIVRCASAADVARALEYARSRRLEIAVRGGGHDVMGASVCDGGVLIDLRSMDAIDVSADSRIARVQAGAIAGQVNEAAHRYGLVAALGCNPVVGVAGLTLAGGLGWFLGRFGASCDTVSAVDIVTADGRQLRATERENADLFWALRGGGGNFGVATAFEYQLQATRNVIAAHFIYAGAQARDFLRLYSELMAEAPDELTVELVIRASAQPPHSPILICSACFSGALSDAERVLSPLASFGPPLVAVMRETAYVELTTPPAQMRGMLGVPARPTTAVPVSEYSYWQGGSLTLWTQAAIDIFVECAASAPPGWSMGLGHYMHGALCRVDRAATPLIRSQGRTSYFFYSRWSAPEHAAPAMAWVDRSLAAMRPHSDAATYINYLSANAQAAIAAAYGAHYQRLRSLKRAFDPQNVFRSNRNIPPS